MELTDEQVASRAKAIYERSVAEALGSGVPEWIEDNDGTWWLGTATRGQAVAWFANEMGAAFTDVRCRREYMRIDLDAIRDVADDMAGDENYLDDDAPVAYTWEYEGWLWERCGKIDDRAVALWRCELRP